MPRISHYGPGKGMNVYLTKEEKELLRFSRCDATIHKGSEGEFLRIHPNPGGRYGISSQDRCETHPWRIQLPGQPGLPKFSVETVVGRPVAGGVFALSRPTMREPVRENVAPTKTRKVYTRKSSNKALPSVGLKEAVEALNAAWGQLGGDLEVSVDQTARKIKVRHLVEY